MTPNRHGMSAQRPTNHRGQPTSSIPVLILNSLSSDIAGYLSLRFEAPGRRCRFYSHHGRLKAPFERLHTPRARTKLAVIQCATFIGTSARLNSDSPFYR